MSAIGLHVVPPTRSAADERAGRLKASVRTRPPPPKMTTTPDCKVVIPQPPFRTSSLVYCTSPHVLVLPSKMAWPARPRGGAMPLLMLHAATALLSGVAARSNCNGGYAPVWFNHCHCPLLNAQVRFACASSCLSPTRTRPSPSAVAAGRNPGTGKEAIGTHRPTPTASVDGGCVERPEWGARVGRGAIDAVGAVVVGLMGEDGAQFGDCVVTRTVERGVNI
mmetsp:Transcript_16871/g.49680  ORF Transcript_16871/g.49680 Transcript_16871/m.49680 type:complete len:222 (-) Transcript_16871:626-1291(-)